VSHTPEQTGGFSDDDLLNIILRGDFPDGGYFDSTIAIYSVWHNFHRWTDITADQQRGIITYLRSLTPVYQKGSINIGAFDDLDSGTSEPPSDATVSEETGTGEDAATVDAAPDAGPDAAVVDAGSGDASDGATE